MRKCSEGQGTEDHGKINNSWYPQRHNAIVFQWILHALSIWNRNDVAMSRPKDILALICWVFKSKNDLLNYNMKLIKTYIANKMLLHFIKFYDLCCLALSILSNVASVKVD